MIHRVTAQVGPTNFSLETGKVAKQADGSVVVQQGETVVLVAVTYSSTPKSQPIDIVPLTVDYREKTYAAGKIPGGFFKREGRPTEKETLTARLTDRPIRPLLPQGFQHETLIMASVLSSDGQNDPDTLALVGASAALRMSSLPFANAIAAVRVGMVNNQWIANPTYQQLEQSAMDLCVAGSKEGILAIEGGFKEVPEQQIVEALQFGYAEVLKLIDLQEELARKAGKPKRQGWTILQPSPELLQAARQVLKPELDKIDTWENKDARATAHERMQKLLADHVAAFGQQVDGMQLAQTLDIVEREAVRRYIATSGRRVDGRAYTDLRQISAEVGVLPRTHGSSLFTRGQTQSLGVTTLGTSDDEQLVESLEGQSYKRFMLHYNFPPFSVGEARPVRAPGRREIGHGALAERSLTPVVPSKEDFPYTIRVVSDILESNGSSSMASVCAGSLSLMDAGVPIRAAVSGVAMGLVKEGDKFQILTDLSGLEDHYGDMDFKVAGTQLGVTAIQLDVKLAEGLTVEQVRKILSQAHPARMKVLEKMAEAIDKPRASISSYAPRITMIKINPEKIREVIGPGGRMIRKIIEETGVTIDIEDDGRVNIASTNGEASDKAIAIIRGLTEDVEVGRIYNARVKRITNFGAFCELLPGNKEGLVHISELEDRYVKTVEEVVKLGDEVRVQVIEIDEQGRINLSRKRVLAAEKSDKSDKSDKSEK
jgi:polyribonucleotide nucleotidyltransferase